MAKLIRLDRVLSNLGLCSRSEAGLWCKKNRVSIDKGEGRSVVVPANYMVDPNTIRVNGQKLPYVPPVSIVFHKPEGYLSSNAHDKHNPKIVFDLLPANMNSMKPTLSIAGRLDKTATGLLILSQDGNLVYRIISPDITPSLEKVYEVEAMHPYKGSEAEIFASGTLRLRSEMEPCKPAKFELLDPSKNKARITLNEGMYHQVVRMIAATGNRVKSIHRTQIGPIKLGELAEGKWRMLSSEEYDLLMPLELRRKLRENELRKMIDKREDLLERQKARFEKREKEQEKDNKKEVKGPEPPRSFQNIMKKLDFVNIPNAKK